MRFRAFGTWLRFVMTVISAKSKPGEAVRFPPASATAWAKACSVRPWVPRIIGLLVIVLIVAGIVFAITAAPAAKAPAVEPRRAALLDELVELERTGANPARREQVISDLERLWRE